MPFSLAHPAAVLPLVRWRLVASALVVGSLAPDFLYFVPGHIDHNFGHTLMGLVVFCIPAGMVALLVFHRVLKRPCVSLLPVNHRKVLAPIAGEFRFGPWRRFLLILFSLVLGALTHVAWDSFTHERGLAVANVSLLKASLLETPYGAIRVFKLLQHASTLVGASVLAYWYLRWSQRNVRANGEPPVQHSDRGRLAVIWSLWLSAPVIGLGYAYIKSARPYGMKWVQSFANRSIVSTTAVLCLELMVFSIFWHVVASRNMPTQQSRSAL